MAHISVTATAGPTRVDVRRFSQWFLLALAPIVGGGCCCGSVWYDSQMNQTWADLESSVHPAPTPIDADETGVSIKLPVLFAPKGVTAMRPGPQDGGTSPSDAQLYPTLSKEGQPIIVKLPGMRFTYEMPIYHNEEDLPVYAHLGVLPPGDAARAAAREQIQQAIEAAGGEAQWELNKAIDGVTADYLEYTGSQYFGSGAAEAPPGTLAIYLANMDHANVLVAYRGGSDVAKQVSLLKAGEASIATITSEEPPKPIDAPADAGGGETPDLTGDYVQVPNANLEMIPPEGFTASSRINGFEKSGSPSQILVESRPTPYAATVGAYNDNYFSSNNITLNKREEVTVDGNPATLLDVAISGANYWILVCGDQTQSFAVTGVIGQPADKGALRAALLSVRIP